MAYTGGDGNAAEEPDGDGGPVRDPFGYILPQSRRRATSARSVRWRSARAGRACSTHQDYDKGIQLSYNTGQQLLFLPAGLKLTAALVNGSGRTR